MGAWSLGLIFQSADGITLGEMFADHGGHHCDSQRAEIRAANEGDQLFLGIFQRTGSDAVTGNGQDGVGIGAKGIGKAETGPRIRPSLAGDPLTYSRIWQVEPPCQVCRSPIAACQLPA